MDINNIDTDLIIPKQFLISLKKKGYQKCFFFDIRYIINNNCVYLNRDFLLNNKFYKKSKIIISKKNFGCGSSREHAIWTIKDFGIKLIIAESYSDIFYDNAIKNNLLLIRLSLINLNKLINSCKKFLFLNLNKQYFIYNKNIYYFYINIFYKNMILKNLVITNFILKKKKEILNYLK